MLSFVFSSAQRDDAWVVGAGDEKGLVLAELVVVLLVHGRVHIFQFWAQPCHKIW